VRRRCSANVEVAGQVAGAQRVQVSRCAGGGAYQVAGSSDARQAVAEGQAAGRATHPASRSITAQHDCQQQHNQRTITFDTISPASKTGR